METKIPQIYLPKQAKYNKENKNDFISLLHSQKNLENINYESLELNDISLTFLENNTDLWEKFLMLLSNLSIKDLFLVNVYIFRLTEENLEKLKQVLEKNKCHLHLTIGQFDILRGEEKFKIFLTSSNNIKILHLDLFFDFDSTSAQRKIIYDYIKTSKIKSVVLRRPKFITFSERHKRLSKLFHFIKNNNHIEALALVGFSFRHNKILNSVGKAIINKSHLISLSLIHCSLNKLPIESQKGLISCILESNITQLDLSGNNLGNNFFLLENIFSSSRKFKRIILRENNLAQLTIEKWAIFFENMKNCSVSYLDLSDNQLPFCNNLLKDDFIEKLKKCYVTQLLLENEELSSAQIDTINEFLTDNYKKRILKENKGLQKLCIFTLYRHTGANLTFFHNPSRQDSNENVFYNKTVKLDPELLEEVEKEKTKLPQLTL